MYVSPFVAMTLYWRAQGALAVGARETGGAAVEAGQASPLEALRAAIDSHQALLGPAGAAMLAAALLVWTATGFASALAVMAGALFALVAGGVTESSLHATADTDLPVRRWSRASAAVLGASALVVGAVGVMAWFFADPAGAIVLACFLYGASSASLLLAMSARHDAAAPRAATYSMVAAPVQALLAAACAALMTASSLEPEAILPLGGLLAESETLRSELLLMPVAITLLSPLVAVMVSPVATMLVEREGDAGTFTAEALSAVVLLVVVALVVLACGLAWAVTGALAIGLVARQMVLVADQGAFRERSAPGARSARPEIVPVLVAGAALAAGGHVAGPCGIALAALGMTATFASASAGRLAREWSLASAATSSAGSAALAATLALLAAAAPVLAAETLHRGGALTLVVTSSPVLLIGVALGAAFAANRSAAFADPRGGGEASLFAALATASAALLPAAAGLMLGAGAGVGVALGFAAWASASAPLGPAVAGPGLPRPLLLAWARTMAMSALVGAPLVC
jgi:hypothetical protein